MVHGKSWDGQGAVSAKPESSRKIQVIRPDFIGLGRKSLAGMAGWQAVLAGFSRFIGKRWEVFSAGWNVYM
jgi:hypothetical protein